MNNEPVAYRWQWDDGLEWHYADYFTDRDYFKLEPLYTHPSEHDLGIAEAVGFEKGYNASKPADTTDEKTINIIQRLIASWSDGFRNYTYDSDEPEENKLRDDVFAILRKAQEK